MKIGEIMTPDVQCIPPDENLVEAASLMRQLDVGVLPVCENGDVIGMLTDRDITIRVVADGRNPQDVLVREAMTAGVVYVYGEQEIGDAVHVMEKYQVRRAPVLNHAQKLVGIVSLGDIAVESVALSGEALHEVSMPAEPVR
jgi:CBS domain-containing protein